jgi:hypothetical protein
MSSSSGQGNGGMSQSQSNTANTGDGGATAPSGVMSPQTQTTGGPMDNLRYDLISTIYHAHKSASSIDQYIQDANQAGNNEAAQFFQSLAQQDQQRAQQAQDLLSRLGNSSGNASSGGATQ